MSHPQISLPRHNSNDAPWNHGPTTSAYASSSSARRGSALNLPTKIRRSLKFPQMDFELAVWEMTSLLLSPKRVFKNYHYHRTISQRSWHRPDPSFTYMLGGFMLLTGLAWGFAYGGVVKVSVIFVVVHFLLSNLVIAGVLWMALGRVLGSTSIRGLPQFLGRRRQRGLFAAQAGENGPEQLEFGYCFDVAVRAYFPVWVFLYVLQFVLMPVIARHYWLSLALGNTLYLLAFGYYTIITFLGYNALPFLKNTELLLAPTAVIIIVYIASLFGFSMPRHFAPVLWAGIGGLSSIAHGG